MTTHGRAVLAACMGLSAPLELTRTAVGDGRVPEGTDLADVHQLVNFVEDAAIAERRHEGDRIYLNVQYTNAKTAKAFLLSEFMIYAKDPETGQETDFIYASLGDYIESIPAYSPAYPLGIWNHRIIIVVSSEINVSVSAAPGLVTHDDLNAALSRMADAEDISITIPTTGWTASGKANYPYTVDVADKAVLEVHNPFVSFDVDNLPSVAACGLSPSVFALDGALRFWAMKVPEVEMTASVTLVRPGGGGGIIISGTGGVTNHNDLTGRDAAEQHPMSAIEGLTEAMAAKLEAATVGDVLAESIQEVGQEDVVDIWNEVNPA